MLGQKHCADRNHRFVATVLIAIVTIGIVSTCIPVAYAQNAPSLIGPSLVGPATPGSEPSLPISPPVSPAINPPVGQSAPLPKSPELPLLPTSDPSKPASEPTTSQLLAPSQLPTLPKLPGVNPVASPPAELPSLTPQNQSIRVEVTEEPADLPGLELPGTAQATVAQLPELTASQQQLRTLIRSAVATQYGLKFDTRSNTPDEVLQFCIGYGVRANLQHGTTQAVQQGRTVTTPQSVNAIGALCWNIPCGKQKLLSVDSTGKVSVRVGHGFQHQSGQLLAMLALSRVPANYPIRVSEASDPTTAKLTVADLVEHEKASCFDGDDLSMRLIGLAFYCQPDESWSNRLGETWSIQRMVGSELSRTVDRSDARVTNYLLGLSCAVNCYYDHGRPPEGMILTAAHFLDEYRSHALRLQNADGSWHPEFFAARGVSTDATGTLIAEGHIVRWLATSTPQDELNDPAITAAVTHLATLVARRSRSINTSQIPANELEGIMTAVNALANYYDRQFDPYDQRDARRQAQLQAQQATRPSSVQAVQ